MEPSERLSVSAPHTLRLGGLLVAGGAVIFGGFRVFHGDIPADNAEAALNFLQTHPAYPVIHIGSILGVLVWAAGFVVLLGMFTDPITMLLGRLATACVLTGVAVYAVDFTIDGVGGHDLGEQWAAASGRARDDLVLAAHTGFTLLRGVSLVAIVILFCLPLILFSAALGRDGYPRSLSAAGIGVGAVTLVAAVALIFDDDLFAGVIVYGVLASIAVPLWSIWLGALLYRRSAATEPDRPD